MYYYNYAYVTPNIILRIVLSSGEGKLWTHAKNLLLLLLLFMSKSLHLGCI